MSPLPALPSPESGGVERLRFIESFRSGNSGVAPTSFLPDTHPRGEPSKASSPGSETPLTRSEPTLQPVSTPPSSSPRRSEQHRPQLRPNPKDWRQNSPNATPCASGSSTDAADRSGPPIHGSPVQNAGQLPARHTAAPGAPNLICPCELPSTKERTTRHVRLRQSR
jgi:hypothetical protein